MSERALTPANSGWQDAGNILCVRLDTLGDVLMTTPAIRALREGRRDRRITLLTSPQGAAAAALVPEIDQVIVYDAPWMKATAPRMGSEPEFAMVERLRQERFDAAVVFTVYSQNPLPSAFLCYLAGIPLRLAHCHENPYQLLTHWVPDPEPEKTVRHEVRRQLDLVATVGYAPRHERLSLRVPEDGYACVERLLVELGLAPGRGWVVIHPGASAASRRYPPEQFAAIARQLVQEEDLIVLFTGTAGECELIAGIQAQMGGPARALSHSLAGRLDLGEMAALLSQAPLLISNNTGPVHMAAALGTPVVVLYALTNPQHTPWQVPGRVLSHDVPCKYCYKSTCPLVHNDCLRLISPEEVVAAATELLAATANHRAAGNMQLVALEPAP